MKKFLVILMASLLVLGLAISCNPEQESPNADMNIINNEVENMDPSKAKDITPEQKVVLGNIVADVQKSLESVLNLFASSRGLGEEPKMSGSVVLSSAATYQFKNEMDEVKISDINVSYDFSKKTMDCKMKINGETVATMPDEALLDAFVEYLLSNTDKIDAKVELKNFKSESEDETVAISGTLTVKNNNIAVSDLSVSFKNSEIDTTLSLNLSATLAMTKKTVAINNVNVTAKVGVKTAQATAGGTFTLKNAVLKMMLDEKNSPIPSEVSVGELSVSVEAPDVASFSVSAKVASMDMLNHVLSVKSVTADASLSGQVKANAEIKNLVFETNVITEVPKVTFEAIGSLKTPSGYIGAKGSMTADGPKDAVVDFNGSAVTMDSFMEAVMEMMAPEL